MTYKLWAPQGNKNGYKALIAAKYVGVKLEQPSIEMGKTNKTPEFLKLNPFGKARPLQAALCRFYDAVCKRSLLLLQVPTLETPQGGVFESNAIARYVARLADKGLFGKTNIDMVSNYPSCSNSVMLCCMSSVLRGECILQAHVEQWIDFSTTEIDPALCSWVYPIKYPGMFAHDHKVKYLPACHCLSSVLVTATPCACTARLPVQSVQQRPAISAYIQSQPQSLHLYTAVDPQSCFCVLAERGRSHHICQKGFEGP